MEIMDSCDGQLEVHLPSTLKPCLLIFERSYPPRSLSVSFGGRFTLHDWIHRDKVLGMRTLASLRTTVLLVMRHTGPLYERRLISLYETAVILKDMPLMIKLQWNDPPRQVQATLLAPMGLRSQTTFIVGNQGCVWKAGLTLVWHKLPARCRWTMRIGGSPAENPWQLQEAVNFVHDWTCFKADSESMLEGFLFDHNEIAPQL